MPMSLLHAAASRHTQRAPGGRGRKSVEPGDRARLRRGWGLPVPPSRLVPRRDKGVTRRELVRVNRGGGCSHSPRSLADVPLWRPPSSCSNRSVRQPGAGVTQTGLSEQGSRFVELKNPVGEDTSASAQRRSRQGVSPVSLLHTRSLAEAFLPISSSGRGQASSTSPQKPRSCPPVPCCSPAGPPCAHQARLLLPDLLAAPPVPFAIQGSMASGARCHGAAPRRALSQCGTGSREQRSPWWSLKMWQWQHRGVPVGTEPTSPRHGHPGLRQASRDLPTPLTLGSPRHPEPTPTGAGARRGERQPRSDPAGAPICQAVPAAPDMTAPSHPHGGAGAPQAAAAPAWHMAQASCAPLPQGHAPRGSTGRRSRIRALG